MKKYVLVTAVTLLLVLVVLGCKPTIKEFYLSNSGHTSSAPILYLHYDKLYVAWVESEGTGLGNKILFRSAPVKTCEFSPTVEVGPAVLASLVKPALTASGSNIYIAYQHWADGDAETEIYFSVSHNSGETFEEPELLSATSSRGSYMPTISAQGDLVVVGWHEVDGDNNILHIRTSRDRGNSFDPEFVVCDNSFAHSPRGLCYNGKVYITYSDKNKMSYIIQSLDGGINFSDPIQLNSNSNISQVGNERLFNYGSNIYVLWVESSESCATCNKICVKKSIGGAEFENYTSLDCSGPIKNLQLNIIENKLYLLFFNDPYLESDRYMGFAYQKEGEEFTHIYDINPRPVAWTPSEIAMDVSGIYVHTAFIASNRVRYQFSSSGGRSFIDASTLSDNNSLFINVKGINGDRFLVWRERDDIKFYSFKKWRLIN